MGLQALQSRGGLRAYGTRVDTGRRSTTSAGHLGSGAATGVDFLSARRAAVDLAVMVVLWVRPFEGGHLKIELGGANPTLP